MNEKTRLLTFSALMAAAAFVLMLLGSLLSVLDITVACLASFAVVLVLLEAGYAWALMTYGVASILSVLILGNKTPALFFAAFFGLYAIVRFLMNKVRPFWFMWAVKIISFNAMLALGFVMWQFVFTIGSLEGVPFYAAVIVFLLAQAVFVLYDVAIAKLVRIYFMRFHESVSKILRGK